MATDTVSMPGSSRPYASPFPIPWPEEHFRGMWEGSLDGFRITGEDGVIIRVNPAFCRIFGLSREQLEGKALTCCYAEESRAELAAFHRGCLAGGELPVRAEWDLRRLDGARICLEASYSLIVTDTGRAVLSTLRDVTAQKRALEELAENEEKYRSFVETTPDWIWEMDTTGRLTYSNASIFWILGYRPDEVVGLRAVDLLDPADALAMEVNLAGVAGKGPGWRGCVLRWRHKEGGFRYLQSYAAPILDAQGAVAGCRGVDHDITDQKRLLQHCDQAQKLESIGRLAGGIAHDFNNLLTVILGYADHALGKLFASDPLYGPLSEIEKAGQRAADLTKQLLMFSRRRAIQPEPVDLNSVIAETERMLRRVIGEDIDLSTSLCPDLKTVMADPGQIAQVLMNLAVNARDAMPKGGEILIETGHAEIAGASPMHGGQSIPAGSYVLLTFSDTGVGMDEHVQARLFEPFFTTKQADKGTGLGLSTVYGIVKQAEGHIWVYSEPMRGSTFKIYLPALPAGAPAPPPQPPVRDVRGTETILLIEDQQEVREYVTHSLEPLGYRVLAAANPEDCIRLLRHFELPIDLILADVVMPGMSGSELVSRIQELRPRLNKIVYMSGYADDLVLRTENLQQGAGYLSKPFTRQMLATKIREVLGGGVRRTVLVIDDEEGVRHFLGDVLRSSGYEVLEAADGKQAMEILQRTPVHLMISDLAMPEADGIEAIQYARRTQTSIKIVSISGRFTGDILKASRLLGADRALPKPVSAETVLETTRELLG